MTQTISPVSGPSPRIAYVEAGWHGDIVQQARHACLGTLHEAGLDAGTVALFQVPGSLEIPLAAQRLARAGYDIILAAGLITDGGIYRHDFVARAVIDGLMRVQLDEGVPILSAVLTPHHFHNHDEHHRFFHDHFRVKGQELAQACLRMLELAGD